MKYSAFLLSFSYMELSYPLCQLTHIFHYHNIQRNKLRIRKALRSCNVHIKSLSNFLFSLGEALGSWVWIQGSWPGPSIFLSTSLSDLSISKPEVCILSCRVFRVLLGCQRCTGQGKDLPCILNPACGPSSDFRGRCSAYIGRMCEFTPTGNARQLCSCFERLMLMGLQYSRKLWNSSWFVKLIAKHLTFLISP